MVGIAVLAHSPLATALVSCAEHVLGRPPEVTAMDILPGECSADCAERVANALFPLSQGDGLLLITDLPGASPCNIATGAANLLKNRGIPVIVLGGASASMLIKAINYRHLALSELASKAQSGAVQAIVCID